MTEAVGCKGARVYQCVARSSLSSTGERLLGLGRGGRKPLVHGLSISAGPACGACNRGRSSLQWRIAVQVFWVKFDG
jgi:hypothetical protein